MDTKEHRKKLIEVALPLEAINVASAREKSIRHGHPSTLHLWWARRPLAACRAVLFGQLVDDPSSWPEHFPTEQAQEEERNRLFALIEQLVQWTSSSNEHVLSAARFEIARSIAWNRGEQPPEKTNAKAVLAYLQQNAPPVYDPFSGGGSIPLEAQRLGLRAYGSDLNPVAVLIGKALVEIPPKFAGLSPVNPDRDMHRHWKGAQGLAEDVSYYGQWMCDEAEKRIGHLYPQVEVTEQAVCEQPALEPLKGQTLTVIAWLWARTVASPNPAANGAQVPLVSSFMLSTKDGKKAWVEPVIDASAPDGYRFTVRSGRIAKEDEAKLKAGTIGRSTGGHCILTNTPLTSQHIKSVGRTNRIGARLMAIVANGPRGRVYLSPTEEHEGRTTSAKPAWEPDGQLYERALGFRIPAYGYHKWSQLFTSRQLVALTTFCDLVAEAREKVFADSRAVGQQTGTGLAGSGSDAEAYSDAIATYLAFAIGKVADYNSSFCGWISGGQTMRNTYGRQALPMVWDYAEANPISGATGSFESGLAQGVNVLKNLVCTGEGSIQQIDAAKNNFGQTPVVISTDPPYYDNIGYADLSDFFYVWLRRTLRSVWPSIFRTLLAPKSDELVATPNRHGGKEQAERYFEEGMRRALKAMERAADPSVPLAIYYAFKQSEIEQEGIASTGWATFLQAVIDAGLMVDGTLPVRSELANRMRGHASNALATSIVLICRKRPESAQVTTRAEFLKALKRELPGALKLLQHGNIAPVDMAQASIGPGMATFTRYAKVLEADDSPMSVKTALQLINAALDEFLSEQETEYDPHTRFAITWFETHAMDTAHYGAAETLATARNVSVAGVAEAGLIESRGGRVRLLSRSEMPPGWDPANDSNPTVWEATQHLIRRLEEDGEQAAADLLRRLDSRADPARDLAYRLYQVCERNKWADEGRAYNGLVIAWPELMKLAQRAPEDLLL